MAIDYITKQQWAGMTSKPFPSLWQINKGIFFIWLWTGDIETTGVNTIKTLRNYLEDYASFPIIILPLGGKEKPDEMTYWILNDLNSIFSSLKAQLRLGGQFLAVPVKGTDKVPAVEGGNWIISPYQEYIKWERDNCTKRN